MHNKDQITFEPTWESLSNYTIPNWFKQAKLGIFIHWGIYSVPAFDNEWYSRNMYLEGHPAFEHHQAQWGHQSQFGYKNFIPLFKGENFYANAWLELFKKVGARYIFPVAEHHDGFPMYDTRFTQWNASKMGPKRDVIAELKQASRNHGLGFGVSSHRAENWWFFNGGRMFDSDVQDAQNAGLYGTATPTNSTNNHTSEAWRSRDWLPRPNAKFLDDWLARCYELVDKYQPDILYFDWWIEKIVFQPYLQKFAAYYYNHATQHDKEVVLTNKFNTFPEGTAVYDLERGKSNEIRPAYWHTDTSVSYRSWGYIDNDEFKTPEKLIHHLADAVSKNANLLLNVGPKPDGTIPDEAVHLLQSLGTWLETNGEAIFGTRHWHIAGEGNTPLGLGHLQERDDQPFTASDIRFTQTDDALYAISLGIPHDTLRIKSLNAQSSLKAEQIDSIHMLGDTQSLEWTQTENSLEIILPIQKPSNYALTLKINLKQR